MTTLVAPAASGKTTLIHGWDASGSSPAMAYLALDTMDNDEGWFWSRIGSALARAKPDFAAESVAGLTTSRTPPHALNELVAALSGPRPVVLALDDADALTNPAITSVLADLLLSLPDSVRVVLAYRGDPPFRQGLLRARGQLAEIDGRDLALRPDELPAFFELHDVSLGPAELRALHKQTEGWLGGTKLAALGVSSHADPSAFVETFTGSNRYVSDLLHGEVLDRQHPAVR
ncbi:MAG TPA: hypothetical protein VGJ86_24410, partial [Acidimicrobiales bacterium]